MEKNIKLDPIQSLWVGGQLSAVEQLCIQSFIDNGHEFHLYVYDEIKNAPSKTKIFDARTIIGEDKIFRNTDGWGKGSLTGFADWFRLMLVQKNGGWWVDMDIICLKPFNFTGESVFCSSYENEYGQLVNNCVFKAPKNDTFINYCLDDINKLDLKKMGFGEGGVFLFQRAVTALNLQNNVVPYYFFNPISWRNVGELILGKMSFANKVKEYLRPVLKPGTMAGRKIEQQSYAVHFWNEVWNANKYDKNGRYDAACLFERLKKKHPLQ